MTLLLMTQNYFPTHETLKLMEELDQLASEKEWDVANHQIVYEFKEMGKLRVRLPINLSLEDLREIEGFQFVIILLESGLASVGFFEEENLLEHKVFRAYMVRKKQGKSQIKYLNTKGKSRAGSRVRLASTLQFFEEINIRLGKIFDTYRVDRICFSGTKSIIPYFFGGSVSPPFRKGDPRIFKVPLYIPSSNYEQLLRTHQLLMMGELRYSTEFEHFITEILKSKSHSKGEGPEEEDW
jgi:hypothetical protein